MPTYFRYALVLVALILQAPGTALGIQELEHSALQLTGPQFDPLGGLSESAVSVEVYEHRLGTPAPLEPVARLQRSSSGTTEHRNMGESPLSTHGSTLVRNYDNNGLLLEEYTRDASGSTQQRKVFLYDEMERIQQVTNYQRQDSIESALVFLYSEDLLGEVAVYEADGRPRWRRVYDYPEENVVTWSLLHADGRLQQAGEFIYNSQRALQQHRSLDQDHLLTELRRFEYDEDNRVVTISTFDSNNELLEEYSFVYDKAGNLVRRVIDDANGYPVSVTRYRYTYDEHGSWTRVDKLLVEARLERPFQVLQSVLTRDITYRSSH